MKFTKDSVDIESFDLFSMKSLVPYNDFTRSISADFKINYEKHYTKYLKDFHATNVNMGFGFTKKIHDDIFIFALADIGLAYGNNSLYPYTFSQTGLTVYEAFNMKSIFEHKYFYNQGSSKSGYHDFTFNQSIFIDKEYSFGFVYNKKFKKNSKINTLSLSFKYYF